jgi:formimidoylglutamase
VSSEDPNWPRASHWLAQRREGPIALSVLGAPLNNSITPGRCDLAPPAIRQALDSYSLYDPDAGIDLARLAVADLGDVTLSGASVEEVFFRIVQGIKKAAANSLAVAVFGGDNAITYPGMHALNLPFARCGLLTFDAHHDVRDLEGGLTDGNPIRALLRAGLPGANIIQIGIQPFANSPAYAQVARAAGITVLTADEVYARGVDAAVADALELLAAKTDAIYVDLDMDVLDRAFAPACAGSRPGGLQPWMLRRAARLCGAHPSVRIIDIVDIDPTKDVADSTVLAAASCFLAFASGVAGRTKP